MSLPDNIATVHVYGRFVDASGAGLSGTVSFTPNARVSSGETGIVLQPVTVRLDGEGFFSLDLAATNDTDLTPTGWAYRVRVSVDGRPWGFSTFLPSAPSLIEFFDLVPVETAPPSLHYVFSVNNILPDSNGNVNLGAISAPVTSVSGKTGAVTLVKGDVGLANVDNTSDLNKPVSTATSTALSGKENIGVAATLDAAHVAAPDPHTQYQLESAVRLPTVRQAYVTSGNLQLNVGTNTWGPLSGSPTLAIPAIAGDYVELSLTCLRQANANIYLDVGVLVSGSIVRYLATGSSTPAGEGDPGLYHTALPAQSGVRGFTAQSGDISGGNVTFVVAIRNTSGASSLLLASTDNPFHWRAINLGSVT